MKNIVTRNNRWSGLQLLAMLLCGLFMLPSCEKEEMNNNPLLQSFGPSPALRGGELRFIGQNLGEVTTVIFPGLAGGTVEVTDIIMVNEREIKVVIPQEAGVGIVVLKTRQGEIKTITPITYSEPIAISKVSPLKVKAGETLTIEGDYLNLIKRIIFFDNVAVEAADFLPGQTRKKLQVVVPTEAQTGKIIISNGEDIPIEVYSQDPVQVVLPTLTSLSPELIRPGNELTITGKDFDLVAAVKFGGEKVVTAFNVNEALTEIRVAVPADAQDSTVVLIAKSGVEISSIATLVTVVPSAISLSSTVIRNGGTFTLTGKDIDLASAVMFGTLEAEVTLQTATSITVVVPDEASATTATLQTLSGKTVDTPAFTYVKPEIVSITPATVMAGNEVTITGSDLDLIRSVIFPTTQKSVNVEPSSATSFTVAVPSDATTGEVTFVTVNGSEVMSPTALIVTPADIPVVLHMPEAVKPGALLVIEGTKLNLVETVMFENNIKATQFGLRSATLLEVYVPEDAVRGVNNVQLLTFAGKTVIAPVKVSGTDPVLPTSVMITNFDGGGNSQSTWGGSFTFSNPAVDLNGTAAMIGKAGVTTGWDWMWAANWGDIPSLENPGKYVLKMDICITKPVPGISVGMCLRGWDVSVSLGNIFANSTNGMWETLTLDLLNSGMVIDGSGDWGLYLNGENTTYDFSGIMIDNLRFDLK
ncbi:MAG: glycan-binding surface protein [Proteiniphilum sp.]